MSKEIEPPTTPGVETEQDKGRCAPAVCSAFALPTVAGRRIRGSNDDFERACLVHIERLQHGLGDYDSAMLDTFCEAVRLVREYNDVMAMPNDQAQRLPTGDGRGAQPKDSNVQ